MNGHIDDYIVSLLLVILAVVIAFGKGDFLISGYNTASEEKKFLDLQQQFEAYKKRLLSRSRQLPSEKRTFRTLLSVFLTSLSAILKQQSRVQFLLVKHLKQT